MFGQRLWSCGCLTSMQIRTDAARLWSCGCLTSIQIRTDSLMQPDWLDRQKDQVLGVTDEKQVPRRLRRKLQQKLVSAGVS